MGSLVFGCTFFFPFENTANSFNNVKNGWGGGGLQVTGDLYVLFPKISNYFNGLFNLERSCYKYKMPALRNYDTQYILLHKIIFFQLAKKQVLAFPVPKFGNDIVHYYYRYWPSGCTYCTF